MISVLFKTMKNLIQLFLIIILNLFFVHPSWAETIDITLLQLNDVYEIAPVSGGKSGGLARIATVREKLVAANPYTYTILAGDLFSPSALGTAKVNGQVMAGAQMIAVMNAVGLDFATFGNHEFDLSQEEFEQRLAESEFTWLSSNVFDRQGQPFPNVPSSLILSVTGQEGTVIKVGLIGVTIDSNQVNYVTYRNAIATIAKEVEQIKDKTDIIVAITHLALAQDQHIAETIPEIDIILGGHEHENIQQWRGNDFTPIFKADANGRTVYIHQLHYDTETNHLNIASHLQPVTDAIPEQPAIASLVQKWEQIGFNAFRRNGFEPEEIVATTSESLDGLEVSIRNQSTILTDIIAQGMLAATDNEADLAIFNGGSIRIDDVLPPGDITQYDVLRIMPFGGQVCLVEMSGKVLEKVLKQGLANKGTGGYLHTANVSQEQTGQGWLIGNRALDPNKMYRVALNDFLLTGNEIGLNYLNLDNPEINLISKGEDIRFALIHQLKKGLIN